MKCRAKIFTTEKAKVGGRMKKTIHRTVPKIFLFFITVLLLRKYNVLDL
jgi:hypothetical protein